MDDGGIVRMQKDHPPSYLLSDVDPRPPWQLLAGLMKQIE